MSVIRYNNQDIVQRHNRFRPYYGLIGNSVRVIGNYALRQAARAAGNYMRDYANSYRKTSSSRANTVRRGSAREKVVMMGGGGTTGMRVGRARRVMYPKYQSVSKFSARAQPNSGAGDNAIYVMLGTHPPKYCLRMMWLALLDDYLKAAKMQYEGADRSPVEMLTADYFVVTYSYKKRLDEGEVSSTIVGSANESVTQFADKLANDVVNKCTSDATMFSIYKVVIRIDSGGSTPITPRREYDMTRSKVSIRGSYSCYIQNRTVAGTNQSTSEDDINNNPIHGKVFYYKGFTPDIAMNDTTANRFFLWPDATTAYEATSSTDARMAPELRAQLISVPHAGVFRKISREARIQIPPGEIRNVRQSWTETHTFNGWISLLRPWLMTASTLDGVEAPFGGTTGATQKYFNFRVGRGLIVAVEKMLSTGALGQSTSLAVDKKHTIESKFMRRGKRWIAATTEAMNPSTEQI